MVSEGQVAATYFLAVGVLLTSVYFLQIDRMVVVSGALTSLAAVLFMFSWWLRYVGS